MVNKITRKIQKKCKQVKLVLSDVDGVLTDGGMFYSEKGEVLKKFNTRDGMGVALLKNAGVKTIFITKENSTIALKRGKKVNAIETLLGIKNKENELKKILKKYKLERKNIAYIGDDVNDLKIMKLVGLSATPSDGATQVKKIVDYVCTKNGGLGAFREFADLIVKTKNY